jgi:cyanophycinase-like exopeptidase
MNDTAAAGVPGPIALVGSGEFLPQMVDVDRALLAGRPQRAAFLPTAAGQEGGASVHRWLSLGEAHYAGMGVEPVPVPVLDRRDADDPALAALVASVGLVYLSGGNPGHVADSLRGTAVWAAIVAAWRAGAALAGCSAGAMALTADAPHVRSRTRTPNPGLALVPHLSVIPHFDRMASWDPDVLARARSRAGTGNVVVGIDEDTALFGGLRDWTVMGRGAVTVFGSDGSSERHAAGATVRLTP